MGYSNSEMFSKHGCFAQDLLLLEFCLRCIFGPKYMNMLSIVSFYSLSLILKINTGLIFFLLYE